MALKLCMVVSDASSFNGLYRGQLEFLSENGLELTLICGGEARGIEKLRARNVGNVLDFGLVRRPSPLQDIVSLFKLFWHFLFNRYDTVVVTTPKAILLGSLASFVTRQRRRVVFFQGRVYENFRGVRRRIFVLFDWVSVSFSHEALFVSDSLKYEFAKDVPAVQEKGGVLGAGSGNGVETKRFSPASVSQMALQSIRKKLEIKNSDFIIISVGRICRDKGIKEFSEIVEELSPYKDIRFIMLGRIEDEFSECLVKRMTSMGQVVHFGYVDNVVSFFALADLHLFLSHREGFGNVAIEAAAMGVPTIAFDVVGVRDSVYDGVSGCRLPFGDVNSVLSKIIELYNISEPPGSQFPGSRRWAVENFSHEKVWENYMNFYRDRNK